MRGSGYTIYSYQILPSPEEGDAKAPSKQGTVAVVGKFDGNLVDNFTLISVGEYRGKWMEMDFNKNAKT
jgi:hypothetical protein